VDATPEQVGELAALHRIVLHGLEGTADLEKAFFRLTRSPSPQWSVAVGRGGALVKALLDAELLKMRSTRATALLVLATLVLAVLTIATMVPGVIERILRSPR
jgi:hypothetical protein